MEGTAGYLDDSLLLSTIAAIGMFSRKSCLDRSGRLLFLGRKFYNQGFFEFLEDLPGLKENFATPMREAWATDDNLSYGVPLIATPHGIYYNKDIFAELSLSAPGTWEELLAAARTIKDAGYIFFANGSANDWDIAESVFMNVAPNFIGGREGRMACLTGKRCFNDAQVVAAFQPVKDLVAFFPKHHELFTYYDSQQLFLQGLAAMWMTAIKDTSCCLSRVTGRHRLLLPVWKPSCGTPINIKTCRN
jgi:raffinose/stachyose/melibiose transport system substrate-binding protein